MQEQIAVILFNYAKLMGMDTTAIGNIADFQDKGNISSWAAEAIKWIVGSKIIVGDGNGGLNPRGEATRAEVAAMLMAFVKIMEAN